MHNLLNPHSSSTNVAALLIAGIVFGLLTTCALGDEQKQDNSQSGEFKLNASQYRMGADKSDGGKSLKGRTDTLHPLAGVVGKNAPNEYKANLQAFKDHANQYVLHLEQVEQKLGDYKQSEVSYDAQSNTLSLHAEMARDCTCHLRAPRIWSQTDGSLRANQMRMQNSQAQLQAAQAQLQNAIQANKQADALLLQRSDIAEEERKLAGEFASLQTEYQLLKTQRDALAGRQSAASAVTSVHGKIRK